MGNYVLLLVQNPYFWLGFICVYFGTKSREA
jgi:hypothetical protein